MGGGEGCSRIVRIERGPGTCDVVYETEDGARWSNELGRVSGTVTLTGSGGQIKGYLHQDSVCNHRPK